MTAKPLRESYEPHAEDLIAENEALRREVKALREENAELVRQNLQREEAMKELLKPGHDAHLGSVNSE